MVHGGDIITEAEIEEVVFRDARLVGGGYPGYCLFLDTFKQKYSNTRIVVDLR